MKRKGITPKFSISELRDMIPTNHGVTSQSRSFHELDRDLVWDGSTVNIKVPVVHLDVFTPETALKLARCKLHTILEANMS